MKKGLPLIIAASLAGCGEPVPETNRVEVPPASSPAAQPPVAVPSSSDAREAEVLRAVTGMVGVLDPEARAAIGFADIGGDEREEALVYLADPGRCGSGGCSLIILTPSRNDWRPVGQTSVTRLPIHRLLTRKDGWNDLAVGVGGGGMAAGTALLRFDRTRYPGNPTVQPILNRLPEGARLVIADDDAVLEPVN